MKQLLLFGLFVVRTYAWGTLCQTQIRHAGAPVLPALNILPETVDSLLSNYRGLLPHVEDASRLHLAVRLFAQRGWGPITARQAPAEILIKYASDTGELLIVRDNEHVIYVLLNWNWIVERLGFVSAEEFVAALARGLVFEPVFAGTTMTHEPTLNYHFEKHGPEFGFDRRNAMHKYLYASDASKFAEVRDSQATLGLSIEHPKYGKTINKINLRSGEFLVVSASLSSVRTYFIVDLERNQVSTPFEYFLLDLRYARKLPR